MTATLLLSVCNIYANSMTNTEYHEKEASKYSKISLHGDGTIFLSFRDLEFLIRNSSSIPFQSLKAVDYGCGAGRSTRYLKSLGIDQVDGFDISKEMIQQAKELDSSERYEVIESASLPIPRDTYDLALLSFVVLTIDNKEEISEIFKELHRVLKPGGTVLCVTLSELFWNPNIHWMTYKQDYPENYSPVSGQKSRVTITSINLELTDIYWLEKDIIGCANEAGLSLAQVHHPLGKPEDGITWQDESKYAPYSIFQFKKD